MTMNLAWLTTGFVAPHEAFGGCGPVLLNTGRPNDVAGRCFVHLGGWSSSGLLDRRRYLVVRCDDKAHSRAG